MRRIYARVSGRVQGVGFRYFCESQARALALSGWVKNLPEGDVELEAQGALDALEEFIRKVRRGPAGAAVSDAAVRDIPLENGEAGYEIRF
jgi:acylphosphatase